MIETLTPGSGVQRSLVRAATLLAGVYVAAQMLADIASLKIAVVGGLAVDAGTFIYPITFTVRDMIHKRLGKSAARTVIVLAAGINLAMAGFLWLVSVLPADAAWSAWEGANVTVNDAFARVLAPAWTIVLASIAAEVVSELIDTEVYHLWTSRVTSRFQWTRVLVSNAASVPVDSLIFSWLAFGWGFGMPAPQVWQIFWFNVAVKGAVTLASLPGIYLVRERGVQ
ncbi:MAG TPA: queuosine precursor transporter [Spirochaetia bacterium]|nr:queuosine precursor transporter [Spirochaetales bacterium]HRY78909.1 queuosine precursor transporter [Spirochaetia bacterium]